MADGYWHIEQMKADAKKYHDEKAEQTMDEVNDSIRDMMEATFQRMEGQLAKELTATAVNAVVQGQNVNKPSSFLPYWPGLDDQEYADELAAPQSARPLTEQEQLEEDLRVLANKDKTRRTLDGLLKELNELIAKRATHEGIRIDLELLKKMYITGNLSRQGYIDELGQLLGRI